MDYSLGDVARILKVSPRRLRYWQQTNLLSPDADAVESDLRTGNTDNTDNTNDVDNTDTTVSKDSADFQDLADAKRRASVSSVGSRVSGEGEETGHEDGNYAFRDLVVLRAIVSLIDKGIPLQRIRRNLELLRDRLPEMDDPAAALRLWDEDSRRIVVRHDGRLEETGGQLILEFEGETGEQPQAVATLADFESENIADVSSEVAVSWFEQGCELDADPTRWAEAIEAYESALEADPEYADAYCNLGAVRYNQGQRAEARRAFEACLTREADHVEANFNLANVLEEEGDDRGALAHYRRALASDPLYPDLHINLALLYEKLGRTRPACDHWRRYLQLDPDGTWAEVARLRLARASDQA